MPITAASIANQVHGELVGDGSAPLTGLAPAEHARPGLTFAEGEAYFAAAERSGASAILVSGPFTSTTKVIIRVANPRVAIARVLPLFFPPEPAPAGIHAGATIHATARIDPSAHVGPGCVIGPGVELGARVVLMGGNQIGRDVRIGEDSCLSQRRG